MNWFLAYLRNLFEACLAATVQHTLRALDETGHLVPEHDIKGCVFVPAASPTCKTPLMGVPSGFRGSKKHRGSVQVAQPARAFWASPAALGLRSFLSCPVDSQGDKGDQCSLTSQAVFLFRRQACLRHWFAFRDALLLRGFATHASTRGK